MISDEGGGRDSLSLTPIRVATAPDGEEGCLVLKDGVLVAILVRIGATDDEADSGAWFLEAGFGPCQTAVPPIFASVDEARLWVSHQTQVRLRA